MRIESVTLENFGIYSRKVFQFESAPFVLIYGPNESGKTTALNGIRQALFGFRTRTPYLTGRGMRAEVSLTLAAGQRLDFARKKGRVDELDGTLDTSRIAAEEIQGLLCNLDLDSYEQLFGFSLVELRGGEAALRSARLSDALAGGGLGGIGALQALQGELADSLATLYKSRGSTSSINIKLAEIQKSQDALRQSQILPTAVVELQEQLAQARGRSEELRQQHARVFSDRAAAKKILEALPDYRQLVKLNAQLEAIEIPDGIDMATVASWGDYVAQRKDLLARIDADSATLLRDRKQLAAVGGPTDFANREHTIEQLGHQAKEVANKRARRRELGEQLAATQAVCAKLLEKLQLDEITHAVRTFSISDPVRTQLEALSSEYSRVAEEIVATSSKLDAFKEAEAADFGNAPSEPPPEDLPEVSSMVTKLEEAEKDFRRHSAQLSQLIANPELQSLALQLAERLRPGIQLDTGFSLPTPQRVQEYHDQAEEHAARRSGLEREIQRLERSAASPGEAESQNQSSCALPLERYAEIVRDRDALVDGWLDELSQPLLAASITIEQQAQRLEELRELGREADRIQQEVIASADDLARYNQRKHTLAQQAEQLGDLRRQLEEFDQRKIDSGAKWLALWQATPLSVGEMCPSNTQAMLDWLRTYAQWQTAQTQVDSARRQLQRLRSAIRELRGMLQDKWPGLISIDIEAESLRAAIVGWESTARDSARLAERRRTAQQSRQRLEQRLAEVRSREQAIATQYATWLKQVPVTSEWPIQRVSALIDSLDRLRREHQQATKLASQIEAIQREIDEFTSTTRRLAADLKTDISQGQPEDHAVAWLEQLQQSRQEQANKIRLAANIEHVSQRLEAAQLRLRDIEGKLAVLSASAGAQAGGGVDSIMRRVQAAEALRSQRSEVLASLKAMSGAMQLEEFMQELQQADSAELELRIEEFSRQLQTLDISRREADEAIGALTERMEQMSDNQVAQRHLQQLQNLRGELAELSEQWVRERAAQYVLEQSIARFAADHEPVLLRLSREYLSQLTGGRYVSIEQEAGKSTSFIVRNSSEEAFAPDRLSTGTREQLYLAIRMAYIAYHSSRHEPLPVLMDDCFVNFDDDRARHALSAIANWNPQIQTVMLTCHRRIVDMTAQIAPNAPIIQLESDSLLTAAVEL